MNTAVIEAMEKFILEQLNGSHYLDGGQILGIVKMAELLNEVDRAVYKKMPEKLTSTVDGGSYDTVKKDSEKIMAEYASRA